MSVNSGEPFCDVSLGEPGLVHEEYLASLRYARLIQQSLMPSVQDIKGLFGDGFVVNMPRDIVSGDFYYAAQKGDFVFIGVGDCTGHGVPGALLSFLGINFLNEIILNNHQPRANRILNQMREKVMKALHQTGGEDQVASDSIDMCFCIINKKEGVLQFAGAQRPLWMVREGVLTEINPDKMPIGIAPIIEEPFTNHWVDLQKGDTFFLFSDGFVDQFGGALGKKYKINPFRQLLLSLKGMDMDGHSKEIVEAFVQWKGDEAQVDDVMVVGFKI